MPVLWSGNGTHTSRLAILVPLVFPGGLGSCTCSKTPKPPHPGGFRFFDPPEPKFADDGTSFGHKTKEFPMQRSSFDFDVITGPAPARPAPKPDAKPPSAPQKPADGK
jgi:hypothetical protein